MTEAQSKRPHDENGQQPSPSKTRKTGNGQVEGASEGVGGEGALKNGNGLARQDSWRNFEETDPFYAILGELGTEKVFSDAGMLDEDKLVRFVQRLMRPGVVPKYKEWHEVWASLKVPIEGQADVLRVVMQVGLEVDEAASQVAEIIAELVRGHRVKVKAAEEAIGTLFECGCDSQGCLARLLFLLFPKSPTTEWGWSRTGWTWQQWWTTTERILNTLDKTGAFDMLCELLRSLEETSGMYFSHQHIWDSGRLAKVKQALCNYGGLMEDELAACLDVALE